MLLKRQRRHSITTTTACWLVLRVLCFACCCCCLIRSAQEHAMLCWAVLPRLTTPLHNRSPARRTPSTSRSSITQGGCCRNGWTTSATAAAAASTVAAVRTGVSCLHDTQHATFGMGCFWKPSEDLLQVPGVIDTVVGYTGVPGRTKTTPAPTYDSVCWGSDPWVEAVRVYYDDTQISYPELLDAFYQAQQPSWRSRQYSSIIFVTNPEERGMAERWLKEEARRLVRSARDQVTPSWTQIEQASTFYQAEQYHQQYWQKMRPRIAAVIALLVVSSGLMDPIIPMPSSWHLMLHTVANGLVLTGCCYTLLERRFDTKVVRLD